MRVTRWKVMAGGLMLAAGGLVAVADGPTPCPPPALPLPAVPAPAAPPFTPVPPPAVATLPALPAMPPPAAREVAPPPQPVPPGLVVPAQPVPVAQVMTKQLAEAVVAGQPPGPAVVVPAISSQPIKLDSATPPPLSPAAQLAVSMGMTGPPPAVTDAVPPAVVPAAAPAPAVPVAAQPPAAVAEARPAGPRPEPAAGKRLKVHLHLGDDRPRFEVRDGEEVYLKVLSDRVEVKSPEKGDDQLVLRAAGRVAFVTPGGDGTCDALAIAPGGGEVTATGTVTFRHTWGRAETTVSADKMTFRLGHAGPTVVTSGYTPAR